MDAGMGKISKGNLLKNVELFFLLCFFSILLSFYSSLLLLFLAFPIFSFISNERRKIYMVFIVVSIGVSVVWCMLSFTHHQFPLEFVEQPDYRVKKFRLLRAARYPDNDDVIPTTKPKKVLSQVIWAKTTNANFRSACKKMENGEKKTEKFAHIQTKMQSTYALSFECPQTTITKQNWEWKHTHK